MGEGNKEVKTRQTGKTRISPKTAMSMGISHEDEGDSDCSEVELRSKSKRKVRRVSTQPSASTVAQVHQKCSSLPRSKSRASDIYYSLDNNMELAGKGADMIEAVSSRPKEDE